MAARSITAPPDAWGRDKRWMSIRMASSSTVRG
jgi:hypothetical protein